MTNRTYLIDAMHCFACGYDGGPVRIDEAYLTCCTCCGGPGRNDGDGDGEYRDRYRTEDFRRDRASLKTLPGLGPVRAGALLRHFGSLKRLKAASVEEIATVPGMGARTAAVVVAYLTHGPHGPDWSDWDLDHPDEGPYCRCGYNGTPEECAATRATLTPREMDQIDAALDAEPRVIPEIAALIAGNTPQQ